MLKYDDFWLPDDKIAPIRNAIYHSTGPGYIVLKNYIPEMLVEHIRALWPNLPPEHMHQKFRGWSALYVGMPNFENRTPGVDYFQNFFWNPPVCDITHAIALSIIVLRNRVEGKPPTLHLAGEKDQAAGYRVIFTKNQDVSNPWHSDWEEENSFDLGRVQATVFLSDHGKDYTGQAFVFRRNDGQLVSMGKDAGVGAGDLILWRYKNEHAVLDVSSQEGQLGFARLLFPPELLYRTPKEKPNRTGKMGEAPFKHSATRKMSGKERADLLRGAAHLFGVELNSAAGKARPPAAASAQGTAAPAAASRPTLLHRAVRKMKQALT